MHVDEIPTSVDLVRRLLAAQHPGWARLPIRPVPSSGTVNALYRLGADMVVRLPRMKAWAEDVDQQHDYLLRLGPLLPVAIPIPLAKGKAAADYPCRWSVYRWLDGQPPATADPRPGEDLAADRRLLARDLADFILAMRQVDIDGALAAERGGSLLARTKETRDAIHALLGVIDTAAATAAWEESLAAPAWADTPVWVHGDLLPGNLLLDQGRLAAVIDFGEAGIGDPACDLMIAWAVLLADERALFRQALGVDDATWLRGRGWALSVAAIALPYYRITNPQFAGVARRMITELLNDVT